MQVKIQQFIVALPYGTCHALFPFAGLRGVVPEQRVAPGCLPPGKQRHQVCPVYLLPSWGWGTRSRDKGWVKIGTDYRHMADLPGLDAPGPPYDQWIADATVVQPCFTRPEMSVIPQPSRPAIVRKENDQRVFFQPIVFQCL